MSGIRLEVNLKRTIMAILVVFLCLFFSLPVSASEAECRTSCKDGPKEYSKWSMWKCEYYTGRQGVSVATRSSEDMAESSECLLRIEGSFSSVDSSATGRYKDFDKCFEDFCVPKITGICGIEDRCSDPKYWIKHKLRRLQ